MAKFYSTMAIPIFYFLSSLVSALPAAPSVVGDAMLFDFYTGTPGVPCQEWDMTMQGTISDLTTDGRCMDPGMASRATCIKRNDTGTPTSEGSATQMTNQGPKMTQCNVLGYPSWRDICSGTAAAAHWEEADKAWIWPAEALNVSADNYGFWSIHIHCSLPAQ